MTILRNWLRNFNEGPSRVRSFAAQFSLRGVDYLLLSAVVALVLFGLLMVYSASFIYAQERMGDGFAFIRKQLGFATVGFLALWMGMSLDYRRWGKWAYPAIGLATFLLVLILVPGLGEKVGGARRWLKLGGFRFQPGEFAKFAIILFVARQLEQKTDRIHTLAAGVFSNILIPLPALLLLLLQPDFGSTVIICSVVFAMMYLAGVPKRFLLGSVLLAAGSAVWLVMGTAYRRSRFTAFWDPWVDPGGKGFQILQSFVGLHHGGLFGVGLGNGKEKLFYLPEAHNDFIVSVIGEELGFLGIAGVLLAYIFIIYRGLKIAWSCQLRAQNRFGMLLAAGITTALGLQSFVNISVVLGLLPTKGLTLPFVSYGGSALLVDLFAVGVLLSIGRGESAASI